MSITKFALDWAAKQRDRCAIHVIFPRWELDGVPNEPWPPLPIETVESDDGAIRGEKLAVIRAAMELPPGASYELDANFHTRAVYRYPTRPVRRPVRLEILMPRSERRGEAPSPLYLIIGLVIAGIVALWSMGAFGAEAPPAADAPAPFAVGPRQQTMRALNPLDEFALDPRVLYFDERDFPPACQFDHLGPVSFHSVAYNISAEPRERYGNGNREFPWGKTGGLDKVQGAAAFKFLRLPPGKPIVWWREARKYYRWRFPNGASVGEVLTMRCADGQWRPFEVRLRHRGETSWHVEILKPYPTADELAAEVKRLRPDWSRDPQLAAALAELAAPRLERSELVDRHPQPAFQRETRSRHVLPDFGDDLAVALLERPAFSHATGDTWAGSDCFAPTAKKPSIVPVGYQGHLLGSDDQACATCHDTTHKSVDDFDAGRDWYGLIRGDDGIFSFHPAKPGCISYNGFPRPVAMRHIDGVLERRDDEHHNPTDYQELLP